MNISRRSVLGAGVTIATAAAASGSSAKILFEPSGLPLGINLYMLRTYYTENLDGALKAVAEIGFSEVETNLETYSAETIKAALKRFGLRCSNLSVLPNPLRGGLSLQTDTSVLAESAHMVGAEYVTCNLFPLPPGVQMRPLPGEAPAQMLARVAQSMTTDQWKRNADFFNAKGAEFKRHGVQFAYHNHNVEFAPHGETNGLAILIEHTDPDLVHFHMDAGWVVQAGQDPVEILRAYPDRFRLMHVKDVAPQYQVNTVLAAETTEVGSGVIDWKRVLKAGLVAGIRHFAVEQEPPYAVPPIMAARQSFTYLSTLDV